MASYLFETLLYWQHVRHKQNKSTAKRAPSTYAAILKAGWALISSAMLHSRLKLDLVTYSAP